MATDQDRIPSTIDLSNESLPHHVWSSYLAVVFGCILFCRLVRGFGAVNRLHKLLVFLCSVSTSAGRQRRSDRIRLTADLRAMRAELKTINMMHNFATYSKLERRIKATTRQLEQIPEETLDKSIIRVVGINVFLYACEGILTGWLISRSPPETITKLELDDARLRDSYFLPFLNIVHYLPAKLVTILWVGLCHSFSKPIVAFLCSRKAPEPTTVEAQQQPIGTSDEGKEDL